MNYKPDENILIAYLYGELDETELEKLTGYLDEHPEERKRLHALADARTIFGTVNDKEVIAPPIFMDDSRPVVSVWSSTSWRWISGIAASFLLLLVAGRLLGVEIYAGQGEMKISFGKGPSTVNQTEKLTAHEIQTMIDASVFKNNEVISTRLTDNQRKVDESLRTQLDQNSKKMTQVMTNASLASQEQVRLFVNGLQNENLRSMKDYLQLSSTEQKKYVENLLVDFSKYLQEQRNQDLNAFQMRLSSMESNTNQFKQETEQILTSIISNSGGQRQNNY